MKFLGLQSERFPGTPLNLAVDVIAVLECAGRWLVLAFAPEWTKTGVNAAYKRAAAEWYVHVGTPNKKPTLIFVTGPISADTPADLMPESFCGHDSEYGYPVWVVDEAGSVMEFED